MLLCGILGGASAALGQAIPALASTRQASAPAQRASAPAQLASAPAQQDAPVLDGIVFVGESPLDSGAVTLHRVSPEESGEVEVVSVGAGGEFRFLLPTAPDAEIEGDIYFASVDYDGVLYFGPAITGLAQLDSLYVVRVFQAEEVPREGVSLPVEVRTMFIEFAGEDWVATDLFAIDNRGTRTLVAEEEGVVWSYPLPPGAREPELGEGDMPPDAVTFEGGRVLVTAPLPPGDRLLMIRYRLEELEGTIPAPGSTEVFEILVKEPFPPLRIDGLEPVDVITLQPGSTYRRYGGTELVDVSLTLVETENQSPPPLGWLALLTTLMLTAGGFLAYARPRRRALVGPAPGLGREALILEVARVDDALDGAAEPEGRSELLERRAALLSLLRKRS